MAFKNVSGAAGIPPLLWSNINDAFVSIAENFDEVETRFANAGLLTLEGVNSTVSPDTNSVYDLGKTNFRWRNLYINETGGIVIGSALITATDTIINLPEGSTVGGIPIPDIIGSRVGATGPTGPGISNVEVIAGDVFVTYTDDTTVLVGSSAGPTGPQGIPGIDGVTGPTGPQGLIGPTGPAGSGLEGDFKSFTTISVSGQPDVVADAETDTLTLIAGSNVTITTDAINDAITINASGTGVVNTGTANRLAYYATTDDAVSETSASLTWNNSTNELSVTGTVSATSFVGSGALLTGIPNGALDFSSIVIGSTIISLGNTAVTLDGLTSVTSNTFIGALQGNADTANTANFATNVILVPTNTTNSAHFLTFVDTATGNRAVRTDTGLTYNPGTNTLSAENVVATTINSSAVGTPTFTSATDIVLTPIGTVRVSSKRITELAAPTDGSDATNKTYVDTRKVTIGSTDVTIGSTVTTFAGLTSVTSSTFTGALVGNADSATVASTVTLAQTDSALVAHYLTFVDSLTGNENIRTDSGLTYTPASNTLTATTFSGALVGNADSATVATTVTLVASNTTNATHYLTFTNAATGDRNVRTDTNLTYNPGSNILSATTFSGALQGNADTATAATTVTLTATNSTDATHFVTFVDSATGNENVRTDTGLTYNPATNTLTAGIFTGALIGNADTASTATKASTVTLVATNTTNAVHYLAFTDAATGDRNVRTDTDLTYNPATNTVTATTFNGALTGNADTATTASTSTNVTLTQFESSIATHYLAFADGLSGARGLRTDTGLSYVPSTNTLTATTFNGALTGNATSATSAGLVTNPSQPNITSLGTLTGLTVAGTMNVQQILEKATVTGSTATGTVNFDVLTSAVLFYTANASGNWTLNVRGDNVSTLNSTMATNQSLTIAFAVAQGSVPFSAQAFTIDGAPVTVRWQNGTAPTAGNANSIDIYTYTIIKTAANTYTVFAAQTRFA